LLSLSVIIKGGLRKARIDAIISSGQIEHNFNYIPP